MHTRVMDALAREAWIAGDLVLQGRADEIHLDRLGLLADERNLIVLRDDADR